VPSGPLAAVSSGPLAAVSSGPLAAVSSGPLAAVSSGPLATVSSGPLAAGLVSVLLLLLLPGGPAAAAGAATVPPPAAPGGLTLELSELMPRVVTADGPDTVTVLGTLRNTGDRPVGELEVRLQRGEALRTDGEVRDVLAGTGRTDAVAPDFTALPGVLDPGAGLPVRLTVPLRGAPQDGLALARPGVYEVLVNVNGVPRDGARARLAAVRLLLPVLSLPPDPNPRAAPAVPAPPGPAADVTVLYPLTDAPRRLATVPGEQTLLTDDDLARSLGPDGRLGGLLAAYAERAPQGSPVRAATCLAVDPDLVATAAAMRQGYLVRGPDGATAPGTGAAAAGSWLDGLAAAARGGCVVALPFADADLVALARGNLGDLARIAVSDGRAIVAEALGTPVVDGTTWPADGVLDEPALADAAAAGSRAVVLRADAVDGGTAVPTAGVVPLAAAGSEPLLGVLADPLLIRAAAAADGTVPGDAGPAGAAPDRGFPAGVRATSTDSGASAPLSTQSALAALVFRAQGPPVVGAPIVLTPPHLWTADATGARALLDGLDLLFDTGRLQPRGLAEVVAGGPAAPGEARRPADPLQVGVGGVPQPVVETVRQVRADVVDLRSAAVPETGVGASVDATFAPLLQAALRPTSTAWHGRPDGAAGAAADAADRIGQLRESIRVLAPPSPYSLGTEDAPLLLTVANGLPVTMEVRLSISSTTGLRVAPIPAQRIPPLGRRQVQVDAQVVRSGQFVVEALVRSPAGRALGPPSRLQVRSTAYGTITVWLTGCAGVLLVVLAARRVARRIRGEPSRRDRVAPPAGPVAQTAAPGPGPPTPAPPAPGPVAPPPTRPPSTPPQHDPGPPIPPPPTLPAPPAVTEAPTRPVPAPPANGPAPPAEPPTRPVPARPGHEPPTRPVPARRR
jgi:hypothetical protein